MTNDIDEIRERHAQFGTQDGSSVISLGRAHKDRGLLLTEHARLTAEVERLEKIAKHNAGERDRAWGIYGIEHAENAKLREGIAEQLAANNEREVELARLRAALKPLVRARNRLLDHHVMLGYKGAYPQKLFEARFAKAEFEAAAALAEGGEDDD